MPSGISAKVFALFAIALPSAASPAIEEGPRRADARIFARVAGGHGQRRRGATCGTLSGPAAGRVRLARRVQDAFDDGTGDRLLP